MADMIRVDVVNDIRTIINSGRQEAFGAANRIAIQTYWLVGKKIAEEESGGSHQADYGKKLIKRIAAELSAEFGTAFSARNLNYYRQFYLAFPKPEMVNTRVHHLTWSHIRRILSVPSPEAREWYLNEAESQTWSVRTLDRNVSTQYFERRLAAMRENIALPAPANQTTDPLEYVKNPVVAEFLGFRQDAHYQESELEQALIDNLERFIMELGKGFAFVERQKHIVTDTDDFYIDLVFYNYRMKSFVLFELKTHKLTHQDIGQLDMYVRMYDDLVKDKSDNPTIGVLLCTDTDSTIAKYSVLNDNDRLFAAKYMTWMPTVEELQYEIEQQKRFFMESHSGSEENV